MNYTKQLEQMIAFMDQEGIEKAQEIDAKAEEEYNISVGQLIHAERLKREAYFKKLEKQVEKGKIVELSKASNEARLRILLLREEAVDEVFGKARQEVIDSLANKRRYKETLKSLMLQASIKMLAPYQLVRVMKNDLGAANDVLSAIVKEFKKLTRLSLNITVDHRNFLPESSICGAIIYNRTGKCKIVNTLECRLKLIRTQYMPVIRSLLFGTNPRRKFIE